MKALASDYSNSDDYRWLKTMQQSRRIAEAKTWKKFDRVLADQQFSLIHLGNHGDQEYFLSENPNRFLWEQFVDFIESHVASFVHFLSISFGGSFIGYLGMRLRSR